MAWLRRSAKEYAETPDLCRIRHPYTHGRGGYMAVDHMEVFIPRQTKIS